MGFLKVSLMCLLSSYSQPASIVQRRHSLGPGSLLKIHLIHLLPASNLSLISIFTLSPRNVNGEWDLLNTSVCFLSFFASASVNLFLGTSVIISGLILAVLFRIVCLKSPFPTEHPAS